jgi:hypothetical protein
MFVKIMPIIIHIGYSKTATTWFQEAYFPLVKNYHFESFKEVNRIFLNSDYFSFNPENTRKELMSKSINGNLLLSSEFITTAINLGWRNGYYSAGMAHKIHATFPDATIIVFIRRQQSLICSAYQQYLKNGGTYGFRRWLYSGEVFGLEHLNFDRLIEYYDKLFGINKVMVYLYEDFKEDNVNFLTQMNKDLGFQINLNTISKKPINLGLRKYIVPIILIVNHFFKIPVGRKRYIFHVPGMTSMGRAVYKFLNPLPIFGNYLTEDHFLKGKDKEKLHDFYCESNRRLAHRVGMERLTHHGYYL